MASLRSRNGGSCLNMMQARGPTWLIAKPSNIGRVLCIGGVEQEQRDRMVGLLISRIGSRT